MFSEPEHALEIKLQMQSNVPKGMLDIVMLFHYAPLSQNINQIYACSHSVRPSSNQSKLLT